MKTEFYVVSINYYEEIATPSVVIILRNKITFSKIENNKQVFSSMIDFMKSFGRSSNNQDEYHKTSIVVSLEDYRNSDLKVGDKIECNMTIKNIGDSVST